MTGKVSQTINKRNNPYVNRHPAGQRLYTHRPPTLRRAVSSCTSLVQRRKTVETNRRVVTVAVVQTELPVPVRINEEAPGTSLHGLLDAGVRRVEVGLTCSKDPRPPERDLLESTTSSTSASIPTPRRPPGACKQTGDTGSRRRRRAHVAGQGCPVVVRRTSLPPPVRPESWSPSSPPPPLLLQTPCSALLCSLAHDLDAVATSGHVT